VQAAEERAAGARNHHESLMEEVAELQRKVHSLRSREEESERIAAKALEQGLRLPGEDMEWKEREQQLVLQQRQEVSELKEQHRLSLHQLAKVLKLRAQRSGVGWHDSDSDVERMGAADFKGLSYREAVAAVDERLLRLGGSSTAGGLPQPDAREVQGRGTADRQLIRHVVQLLRKRTHLLSDFNLPRDSQALLSATAALNEPVDDSMAQRRPVSEERDVALPPRDSQLPASSTVTSPEPTPHAKRRRIGQEALVPGIRQETAPKVSRASGSTDRTRKTGRS